MTIRDNLDFESEWILRETAFDDSLLVNNGSNFMTANGYLGYRGTFPEWTAGQYVGCVVTDTYDNADGKWTELCTVPNALYTRVLVNGTALATLEHPPSAYERRLDFRYGIHSRDVSWRAPVPVAIHDERFASYDHLHLVAERHLISVESAATLVIETGIDGEVWSLNGEHFSSCDASQDGSNFLMTTITQEHGIKIVVAEGYRVSRGPGSSGSPVETLPPSDRSVMRRIQVEVSPQDPIEFEKFMVVFTSNDVPDPREAALDAVRRAVQTGFAELARAHRGAWDDMWQESGVRISGDPMAQALLNYNMYHSFIATPQHSDHLPVGARGLSCQAYQGSAFWDQEIFNLPMFLHTRPQVARNILTYRYKTLDGARKKARDLGFSGAFYAWVSAATGEEICPSYFFKDVLSGRRIHNHFNEWQIHISPDISFSVWRYYEVTGDLDFLVSMGAEIIFEVANFLVSRAHFKKDKNRFEFIRLLGPDEYHENVDNNIFTNYQAAFATGVAVRTHELLAEHDPAKLDELATRISVDAAAWQELSELTYIPPADPETRLIEQFDGFFKLEDITPEELKERLLDPGEYWGWPNGIAIETQVSKQADVTQLFMLHPGAYSDEVMRANFDYYEPRTQHGSSLSPSVYAIVGAWIGRDEMAYEYFVHSCSIDLLNNSKAVSGGTFIGGIHTAACGVAWQLVAIGFLGLRVDGDMLRFKPNLPAKWSSVRLPLTVQGVSLDVTVSNHTLIVSAENEMERGSPEITVTVHEQTQIVRPGLPVEISW